LGAAFKYAIAAFSAGDFPAFAMQLEWLGKRCMAMRPGTAPAGLPPGEEGDRWRGELHVLLALTQFNDIEAMSSHHKMALALLKGPTSLYGADSPWALGSPSVLFMFYRTRGKLQDALRLMRECMPMYYQLASHHGAGAEYLMEAEALYYAGEFDKAEAPCRFGLGMAERHEQLGNVFCAMFLQMRLALLAGNTAALFGKQNEKPGLLADMRSLITRGRDYFMLHTADLCEGWLYAALGLYDKIPGWLRSELSGESRLYAFARGYYFIVHGRALLLAGENARVIGLFNGILQAGHFAKNLLFDLYGHIYLAAAYEKTGQCQEAASALKTALDIALPDKLRMPFAENYDLIGPLLKKTMSGKENEKALSSIEGLARQMQAGRESVLKELQASTPSAFLSDLELEVAHLVVKGFPNKKIAEKLNIKVRTVKDRLTRIYRKTGQSRSGLHKIFHKTPA
jgi:LuxR family maltose regulon positive regulatory protein